MYLMYLYIKNGISILVIFINLIRIYSRHRTEFLTIHSSANNY